MLEAGRDHGGRAIEVRQLSGRRLSVPHRHAELAVLVFTARVDHASLVQEQRMPGAGRDLYNREVFVLGVTQISHRALHGRLRDLNWNWLVRVVDADDSEGTAADLAPGPDFARERQCDRVVVAAAHGLDADPDVRIIATGVGQGLYQYWGILRVDGVVTDSQLSVFIAPDRVEETASLFVAPGDEGRVLKAAGDFLDGDAVRAESRHWLDLVALAAGHRLVDVASVEQAEAKLALVVGAPAVYFRVVVFLGLEPVIVLRRAALLPRLQAGATGVRLRRILGQLSDSTPLLGRCLADSVRRSDASSVADV